MDAVSLVVVLFLTASVTAGVIGIAALVLMIWHDSRKG